MQRRWIGRIVGERGSSAMQRRSFYNPEMREGYARKFSAELAAVLYELGVTHQALADALGVTRHTVDSWTRIADPKIPGERNLHSLQTFLERRHAGAGRRVGVAAGPPTPQAFASAGPQAPPAHPAAPGASEFAPPGNIPPALTGFIGRGREIAQIRGLLACARLVTLTGAGGIGKTRLALEVTRDARGFAAGTWLVELDALAEAALIPAVCAQVLGTRLAADTDPAAALAKRIAGQAMLLVLDNCEHLLAGCAPLVERLLQDCPNLRILATSREALGCAGEVIWRVSPLSLLAPRGDPPAAAVLAALQESEAGQLFLLRAQHRQPGFTLTVENALPVAHICTRLDGMPLAIELAVARLPALSPEEIAPRLDASLRLLTRGARTSTLRHQALQSCLDWSHDLLMPAERVLFRRLAVFVGGWTLGAAEAVWPARVYPPMAC